MDKLFSTATPDRFDFFGLGSVTANSAKPALEELAYWPFYVSFKVWGEDMGLCLVAFRSLPFGVEAESMAIEIANILASKFATGLADECGELVPISPPETFRRNEQKHRYLAAAIRGAKPGAAHFRRYEFVDMQKRKTELALAYLPAQSGQT